MSGWAKHIALAMAGALLVTAAVWAADDQVCLRCHPSAAPGASRDSAHATLGCAACHPGVTPGPHAAKPGHVACEQCHVGGPTQAGARVPLIDLLHVRATADAPACTDCHGHHGVSRVGAADSKTGRDHVAELCGGCHENTAHAATTPQVTNYAASIHATRPAPAGTAGPAATCTDCHGVHATARQTGARLFAARTDQPTTCGKCHRKEDDDYSHSVHGGGLLTQPQAMPACTDCHGTHDIMAVSDPHSPASPQRAVATCNRCHGSADFTRQHGMNTVAAATYDRSYHGIAYRFGNPRAPTCVSCHSAHDILPQTSPASPTHVGNVARACGQCHPGAEHSPQIGRFHVLAAPGYSRLLYAIRVVFLALIIASLVAFFIFILVDLITHSRLEGADVEARFRHRLEHLPRLTRLALVRAVPLWHVQRVVLLWAFIILAVTGLALLIPDTAVGRLIVALCGGMSGRAIVHRVAAALLIAGFVFQALWLLGTARGRQNLCQLVLRWSDVRRGWRTLVTVLKFRPREPGGGQFGCAEKLEFWALVGGMGLLTLTGLLLAGVNWALGHAPKWVLDAAELVHKWEAILAVGAIIIWTVYHGLWKPGIYPGNRTELSGEVGFEQLVLDHPLEYARAVGWVKETPDRELPSSDTAPGDEPPRD